MIYSNRPLFTGPTGWLPGTINKQGENWVTVSNPDGTVLSVQPDGSYQSRPAGTAGPYELAQFYAPDRLVYESAGNFYVVSAVGQ